MEKRGLIRCPEFDAKCRQMYKNRNMGEIAKELGVSRHTVLKAIQGAPIIYAMPTEELIEEARDLAKNGLSCQDIADKLGISKSKVQRYTVAIRKTIPRVKRKTKSELNREAVLKLWEIGHDRIGIAESLGLSYSIVGEIIRTYGEDIRPVKKAIEREAKKVEKVFETRDPMAGRYPITVNGAVIYVKNEIPREKAIKQWNEKQTKKEQAFLKDVRSRLLSSALLSQRPVLSGDY